MKLDKFFDKSPPIKRPSRAPIILQNEAKRDALQEEIDSLTSRLGMQTQLQQERDAAIRRKGAVEEQYSTIQEEFDEIINAEDLSKQHTIKYGCVKGGSTYAFFRVKLLLHLFLL